MDLIPYPPELRHLLLRAMAAAREWQFAATEPPVFRDAIEGLSPADGAATLIARK